MWLSSDSISAVVHQISPKPDNFSLRYGDLTPSWILEIGSFCHVAFVGMPFVLLSRTKFRWNRTIGWIQFLVTSWLSSSSIFAVVYQISSIRNLQFLSRGLRRHAVLLHHTNFRWYRTIGWYRKAVRLSAYIYIARISLAISYRVSQKYVKFV